MLSVDFCNTHARVHGQSSKENVKALRTQLEPADIQAIASEVVEMLKPLLAGNGRQDTGDNLFTPETLAKYLHVDLSWVYKQVSLKTIPYFKSGKYTRFKKVLIEIRIPNLVEVRINNQAVGRDHWMSTI